MDSLTFSLFLEYLYSKFAVTFVLSMVGVSIRELLRIVKAEERDIYRKISFPKLIASTVFCTIVMCALIDYVNMSFSIYVLVNVLAGIWSESIIGFALDRVLVTRVFISIIKTIGPIGAAISESLKKASDDENKPKDKDNNKDTDKDNGDKPSSG